MSLSCWSKRDMILSSLFLMSSFLAAKPLAINHLMKRLEGLSDFLWAISAANNSDSERGTTGSGELSCPPELSSGGWGREVDTGEGSP